MRIRRLAHSVYQIQYHIVWGTKYRRKVLKYYVRGELIRSLYKTLKLYPDWYLHQVNTGDDHVHMLLEVPPIYSIATVVKLLKSESSAHLRKTYPFINNIYNHSGVWSAGYFVSTVGLNEQQIIKYIANQNRLDRSVDVTEEFS
jgi:putative transposase